MRTISALALVGLLALAAGCGTKPEGGNGGGGGGDGGGTPADDLAALQGQWAVTNLEVEFPPDSPAEQHQQERKLMDNMLKSVDITVKDNLITARLPEQKEPGYAVFKLDSSKSPKEVDFNRSDAKGTIQPSKEGSDFDWKTKQIKYKEGPPETIKAIYQVEGDTLTIAAGLGKNAARPTEFKPVPPKSKKDRDGVAVLRLKKK